MPENMILSGGTPAAQRALELAAGHHVGAGAEPGQRRDHRLVGVRLDGVADERRHVGEGAGEHPVVPLERRGGIAIERRADRLREACEIDRLGVQHAVAIGEVVHRRAQSISQSGGACCFGPAGAIGRPSWSYAGSASARHPAARR